jgi:hypothetical protein
MTIPQRDSGSLRLSRIWQEIPGYYNYLSNGTNYYLSYFAGLDDGVPTTKALSIGHFYGAEYDTGHYPSYSASSKHDGVTGDFSNTTTDLLPIWYEQLVSSTGYQARIIRIPKYLAGETVRLAIQYQSGTSYTGDFQIFEIETDSGTSFNFELDVAGFERESTRTTSYEDYADVSWQAVTTGTTTGLWMRDASGTGSGGTGLTGPHPTDGTNRSYYLYTETSTNGYGFPNRYFWLRSPTFTLGTSATVGAYSYPSGMSDICDNITVYFGAYGATIGKVWVNLIVS